MKERELQGWVIDVARRFGWRVYHVPMPVQPRPKSAGGGFVPDPRGRGLPDLILFHTDPPRMIFAELKGDGGALDDAQREFLMLARGVHSEIAQRLDELSPGTSKYAEPVPFGAYVWLPHDRDAIETILRSKVLP